MPSAAVGPYAKWYVVWRPPGLTVPCNVAPLDVTAVAAPMMTTANIDLPSVGKAATTIDSAGWVSAGAADVCTAGSAPGVEGGRKLRSRNPGAKIGA